MSMVELQRGDCLTIEAYGEAIGVLLFHSGSGRLQAQLRRDWPLFAAEDEVLPLLEDDLNRKAVEMGAESLLRFLEDTLSNTVTLSGREAVTFADFDSALWRLYRARVKAHEQPFVTHLPLYSLKVACGELLENETVEPLGWVEVPPGVRLTEKRFVAQAVGQSMEPEIPDGSLCLFELGVAGSRTGRRVVVEDRSQSGNDRYTLKEYKRVDAETVHLIPLNPEFPVQVMRKSQDEDRGAVIAEFKSVLE
ncbi:MAG: S24 family peptidase [Acidobacteria bacterium]|nr:S24 family peptidase [Acidobacteriota bacterium]